MIWLAAAIMLFITGRYCRTSVGMLADVIAFFLAFAVLLGAR
jgi:hypothetical protein